MIFEIDEKEFRRVVSNMLEEVAKFAEKRQIDNINDMELVASGLMRDSVGMVKLDELEFVVGNEAPYAPFVNWGAPPHRPPFEKILKWVQIKKGESGIEARNAAKRIVMKIEREGLEPKPFFTEMVAATHSHFRARAGT